MHFLVTTKTPGAFARHFLSFGDQHVCLPPLIKYVFFSFCFLFSRADRTKDWVSGEGAGAGRQGCRVMGGSLLGGTAGCVYE